MRGTSRIFIAWASAAVLLVARHAAADGGSDAAAMITSVNCAAGDCVVKRGSGQKPARALFVLASGDVVAAHSGTIAIQTSDHRALEVKGPDGRLVIQA